MLQEGSSPSSTQTRPDPVARVLERLLDSEIIGLNPHYEITTHDAILLLQRFRGNREAIAEDSAAVQWLVGRTRDDIDRAQRMREIDNPELALFSGGEMESLTHLWQQHTDVYAGRSSDTDGLGRVPDFLRTSTPSDDTYSSGQNSQANSQPGSLMNTPKPDLAEERSLSWREESGMTTESNLYAMAISAGSTPIHSERTSTVSSDWMTFPANSRDVRESVLSEVGPSRPSMSETEELYSNRSSIASYGNSGIAAALKFHTDKQEYERRMADRGAIDEDSITHEDQTSLPSPESATGGSPSPVPSDGASSPNP